MNTHELIESIAELTAVSAKMDSDIADKIAPILLPTNPNVAQRGKERDPSIGVEVQTPLAEKLTMLRDNILSDLARKEEFVKRISF